MALALSAGHVAASTLLSDGSHSVDELATVQVSGTFANDPLSPTAQAARHLLRQWPGSVGLVTESDYADSAILSLRDALSREPGVFVQTAAGQQSAKLSIRGSGLASPLGVRGLALLRDGLPLTQADGTVDPSYADPFNARYIEVYRGSNALLYGAASLGGAINIVSPTGYSHPGLETRLQTGSYSFLQAQARGGQVFDNGMDAFASVSRYQTNGSAARSRQEATRFYGNLGFRPKMGSEGRFHLDIASMDQEITNPLTLAQLQGSAALNQPPPRWPDHRIRTRPHVRLAYQHAFDYGRADRITVGAHYIDTSFDLLGTVVPIDYRSRDYGLSIRGEVKRSLAGHENQLVWGASVASGRGTSTTHGPFTLPGGAILDPSTRQYEDIHSSAQTAQLYLQNTFFATPQLSVVAAIQAVSARRHRNIDQLGNPQTLLGPLRYFKNVDHTDRYTGLSPKAGLLWQPAENLQLYANISRSYEPPTALEFYNSTGTTNAQKGITYEIGSRGDSQMASWEAALFHSRIKDELLSTPKYNAFGQIDGYQGGNIPDTTHSGLELRLHGSLPTGELPGMVDWGLAYTWSRFRFSNDPTFGNKRLPGIPVHYGRLDLTYRHPSGLYLGPDAEFASAVYVDQANTLQAPGYAVLNFTVGYAHPSGKYRVFLNARNLADKRYAASTQYLVAAQANEAAFNPGLRRSIFAGVELLW